MKLFLDTNVLIDFILERQPFYQAAAMIISYAEENKVQICVSSLSLVTTIFICIERCKMPIEMAIRNKIRRGEEWKEELKKKKKKPRNRPQTSCFKYTN